MNDLKKSIKEWMDKNKGEVVFIGSFISFDKKGEIKKDMITGFGPKKLVKISLSGIKDMIKEEKEDFINW